MSAKQIHIYIERLSNLLRNELRKAGAAHGLQPVQMEALHYLSVCNRYSDTPMGVTEYLGQTKGTISQSLNVLTKKGFVTKKADSKDKRITHLEITNSGKKLLNEAIPAPVFIDACKLLHQKKQTQIVQALDALLSSIQQANNMKSFGVCRTCRYNQRLDDKRYVCGLTQEPLSSAEIQLICREHEGH